MTRFHRTTRSRFGLLALAVAAISWSCVAAGAEPAPPRAPAEAERQQVVPIPPFPAPPMAVAPPADVEGERGLVFRLEEASGRLGVSPRQPLTPASRLSAAEADRLLGRLPAPTVAGPDDDASPFPPASPPPPRTGATLLAAFPPPDSLLPPRPVEAAPSPLEVLRILPAGETELAPHLSITFSQPMVPLAALGEIAARAVPVRLSPATPGRWSWLDTRTLRFEPDPRFPMATRYTVEVPAGVRSELGGTLAAAVREEFATPAPIAICGYPHADGFSGRWGGRVPGIPRPYGGVRSAGGEPASLEPVILIAFDQRVDPAAVLPTVSLTADGRRRDIRLASEAEVARDSVVSALVAMVEPGRWIALRPARPLPGGADVRVVVGPRTPSAEGPRATASPQELRFRTYGPLAVEEHGCSGQSARDCWPGGGFWVRFNNPIDVAAWSDDLVRIEPDIPGLRMDVHGRMLQVRGRAAARTTYRLILEPGVRDVFGQTLGARRTLEFRTGDHGGSLSLPGAPLVVLDPARPPRLAVHSSGQVSFRVRVHAVSVDHWDAYLSELDRYRRARAPARFTPPGRPVLDTLVAPAHAADALAETWIDLARALSGGLGHAVVVVEPSGAGDGPPSPDGRLSPQRRPVAPAIAWVQSTRIGLGAAVDGQSLQAWATSLVDGRPLPGVRLALQPSGQRAATDLEGLATMPLAATGAGLLVARHDGDTALLPENPWGSRGQHGWRRSESGADLRWLVFSDRGLYRPGEQAHLKGWIRELGAGPRGDLAVPAAIDRVRFTATGPRGEELGAGDLVTGALGGFDTMLDLPRELNTGHAHVRFEAPQATQRYARTHLPLRIHEFRRPEYEVTVDADAGPHVVGGTVAATVRAGYYGGGGLAEAAVDWRVTAGSARYTPPGWDRWHFGRAPFWGWRPYPLAVAVSQELAATTDAHGEHHVRVALLDVDPPFTASLRVDAQVQDVDRQVGSSGVDVLVHPAAYYVGLRSARSWAQVGDSLAVGVVVVDLDGGTVPGRPIELRLAPLERDAWPMPRTGGQHRSPDQAEGDVVCRVTTGTEPVDCVVRLTEPGPHVVRAEVRDDQDRVSRTELPVWVAGSPARPAVERPGGERLELIADREEYQPGDVARVLVQAPFHPAEGLWTLRRGGLVETGRFRTDGPAHELRVPIEEGHIPGAHLHVELVGAGGGDPAATGTAAAPGSEYRTGEVMLRVPPLARTLDVRVAPADTISQPGATTSVTVEVRDALGRPRPGAEVALWMVDEAILSIGDYRLPDPIDAFYPQRGSGVRDHALRHMIVRARPDDPYDRDGIGVGGPPPSPLAPPPPPGAAVELQALEVAAADQDMAARARVAARGGEESEFPGAPVDIRVDFTPLAVFEPALRTGEDGRVTVPVTLPGTLTRYRVMAVAVDGGTRFGRGEASVTARRELMVRLAAPRFLSHGDRVELAVTVQNLTAGALDADVAVRGDGLRFDEGRGRRVVVPAGDRVELRIPATALRPGPVQLEAVAASGSHSDAAAVTIPVYEPGTAEAFATYGELDDADLAALPLSVPRDAVPGFGGLEVTVTSTALHALTDALLFLKRYPYEGPEPVASRVLAVAAVRDVLEAFEAEGLPPADSIVAAAERDIAGLARMQRRDGGWSLWHRDRPSDPFVSIHATHALQRARENGFSVPADVMDNAASYLRTLERWAPEGVRERDRRGLVAYSLYVRARMGDPAAIATARRHVRDAGPTGYTAEVGVAAAAWLLHALAGPAATGEAAAGGEAAELRRQLTNRVTETAAAATFATSYDDGSPVLLHSDRRSDAIALEALIQADPRSDLVPKLARGLLDHRTRGRWRTTQENAWVLLALGRYFQEYERVTPDFATRVWVGDRFAGAHEFRGRSADRWHLAVPLRALTALDPDRLLVQRDGAGRLYYRAGLRYAPADHALPPLDRGFVVERSYEAVDDPADVRRGDDGAWRIRAGSRVRVRVSMIAPSVRRHVALMDPLPAGLEPLNPELRGAGFDDDPGPIRPDRPGGRGAPPPLPPGAVPGGAAAPGVQGAPVVQGAPGAQGAPVVQGAPVAHRLGIWPPWLFRWFEHQNLRDDRAEAFASYLPAGVYEYTYLARATSHGTFIAAPPRAEEMYAPETFGRGAQDRVIIE